MVIMLNKCTDIWCSPRMKCKYIKMIVALSVHLITLCISHVWTSIIINFLYIKPKLDCFVRRDSSHCFVCSLVCLPCFALFHVMSLWISWVKHCSFQHLWLLWVRWAELLLFHVPLELFSSQSVGISHIPVCSLLHSDLLFCLSD